MYIREQVEIIHLFTSKRLNGLKCILTLVYDVFVDVVFPGIGLMHSGRATNKKTNR